MVAPRVSEIAKRSLVENLRGFPVKAYCVDLSPREPVYTIVLIGENAHNEHFC